MISNNKNDTERVLLAGVHETSSAESEEEFFASMDELDELTRACFMLPVGIVCQNMEKTGTGLYIGSGKLEEIKERAEELDAGLVIFNDTLTPTQLRNLQNELEMPVMDRTSLILEIFRKRARTREAILQVELASLQYLKPRLTGMSKALTRQGGTSGSMSSRGAGEKKLELDRRRIDHRITELRRELKEVVQERQTQRKRRLSSKLPLVALVGYTNAGKSTIMNAMLKKFSPDAERSVFEADMLFATLDTTVRRVDTGNNKSFLLSDTVGFIHKLPHDLVEAFKSTLEEVKEADLIVQVVDVSDSRKDVHISVTRSIINELGAGDIPVLTVYNKADLALPPVEYPKLRQINTGNAAECGNIYISAKEDESLTVLADTISSIVYGDYEETEFLIPYDNYSVFGYLMDNAVILSTEYREDGVYIKAECHRADIVKLKKYCLTGSV